MTATGWNTLLIVAAPFVSIYASTFVDSTLWSFAVTIVVFLVMTTIAGVVFRRLATPEELRRELEDRVRNPPS